MDEIGLEALEVVGGWRIEVTQRGQFWNWRRGSGKGREAKYGGKFRILSEERKAQYEQRKRQTA